MNLAREVQGKIVTAIPLAVVAVSRWRRTATLEVAGQRPGETYKVTLRPGDSLTLQHTMDVANRPRLFREPS
jgi:hypothetical protein